MKRILIPVDGTAKSLAAVRAAVSSEKGGVDVIDLLNVQPRLHRHISQFVSREDRDAWRRDNAERALEPARQIVEKAGIACRTHVGVGPIARVVADTARLLGASEIVIGATRRGLLGRLLANSPSTRLLQLISVPVRVIPAAMPPGYERFAVPAGLGVALLVLAAQD
jgi:nucleotide-binding universal stress UspA family protein